MHIHSYTCIYIHIHAYTNTYSTLYGVCPFFAAPNDQSKLLSSLQVRAEEPMSSAEKVDSFNEIGIEKSLNETGNYGTGAGLVTQTSP